MSAKVIGKKSKSNYIPPAGNWYDIPPAPTAGTINLVPFGPEGDVVLEADTYAIGQHIPEILRWTPDGSGGWTTWGSNYNTGWYPTKTPVPPGTLIEIDTTVNWRHIKFFGLKGTKENPIWIKPKDDGTINISRGIQFTDCQYVIIDMMPASVGWSGGPARTPTLAEANAFRYQFQGDDPLIRFSPMDFYGVTKGVHVRGIKGVTCWYGFILKTDPMCNTAYNFPLGLIEDVTLQHFYLDDIERDGGYIGNSANMMKSADPANGRDIYCYNGVGYDYYDSNPYYLPMKLKDIKIMYGSISRCGHQGLVIGGCYYGKHRFSGLKIRNIGYSINNSQGFGIGNGGNNRNLEIDNCDIENTYNNNIGEFGLTAWVHHNRLNEAGYIDTTKAFTTNISGWLSATTDIPTLLASRPDLQQSGDHILNKDSGGVYNISATTKINYPENDTKTIYYYENQLGVNSRNENVEGFFKFDNYGPADNWTTKSVLLNNTRISDGQPIRIDKFIHPVSGVPWPTYSTNAVDIPPIS